MASEPHAAAAAADTDERRRRFSSVPDVCAPCWICLEDGPNEAGEPLIRACACRGETSAGYHLSCIIEYAWKKTQGVIAKFERHDRTARNIEEIWRSCPNCTQVYNTKVLVQLTQALVRRIEGVLPETHYLHYESRKFMMQAALLSKKNMDIVETELHNLLQILDASPQAFVDSFCQGLPIDEQRANGIVETERAELLMRFGELRSTQNDYQSALEFFEKAQSIYISVHGEDTKILQYSMNKVRETKIKLGLEDSDGMERELRQQIADIENSDIDNPIDLLGRKIRLHDLLLQRDPPEYLEAMKLLKEGIESVTQMMGSDHEVIVRLNMQLDHLKASYRKSLLEIRQSME